jgi:SAM-dependent methyltransferase
LVRKEGLGRVQESLPDPMHTLPMDPAARTARDDPPPAARYDAVADFYQTGWPDTYTDPASVALFELLGPPADERVLDLACGHGRISRELARRGARVVGVDLSTALLDRARARDADEPLPISYVHGDAASRSLLDGEVFDAVVCSFGLSDIDDLDGAIATVARLLAPGGRFVFSLLHPCFAGGQDVSGSWPSCGQLSRRGLVGRRRRAVVAAPPGGRQPPQIVHLPQHTARPRPGNRLAR